MDYHELYIKLFGTVADTVDALDDTVKTLLLLRERLITVQREAEDAVIRMGEDEEPAGSGS